MKAGTFLVGWIIIGGKGRGGCALPFPKTVSGFGSPGRREELRWIEYGKIPEEKIFGDFAPAFDGYLVTAAAFHNKEFGLTIGPDDDVRLTADDGDGLPACSSAAME